MKRLIVLLAALLVPLTALPALAAPLRVFVSEMNAVGVKNRDEMKITLQTLLSSRLNGEQIVAVGSAAEADVVISGTYVTIGKVFSVDALARTTAGRSLARAFVEGNNQDELIPSIGKLADKLSSELAKNHSAGDRAVNIGTALSPAMPPKSDIIKNQQVHQAPAGDFIKPQDYEHNAGGGWMSKRLEGSANLMATGNSSPDGSREIFLAGDHRLSYYRQGAVMKLVAETDLGAAAKIISLDVMERNDGVEIYVTLIRSDELASQVWRVKGDKLTLEAEGLPYFFRAMRLAGGQKKLYAQAMGRTDYFYGDVAEAVRAGSVIKLINAVKMPRFGNIYTFNQFRADDGKMMMAVINPDGYLLVYDQDLKEVWRSNDKFGGSELFFQKEDLVHVRETGDKFRWTFLNQRIQVTSKGEVLVGKNEGFWVLGNARSYKKGAVFCFTWNGSSLEEKWRTRDTQNYMPDYAFDETRNELMILQTVQRPGITGQGASSLSIKKVE